MRQGCLWIAPTYTRAPRSCEAGIENIISDDSNTTFHKHQFWLVIQKPWLLSICSLQLQITLLEGFICWLSLFLSLITFCGIVGFVIRLNTRQIADYAIHLFTANHAYGRFKYVLLVEKITDIAGVFKHQDLRMFGLKLNKYE